MRFRSFRTDYPCYADAGRKPKEREILAKSWPEWKVSDARDTVDNAGSQASLDSHAKFLT